MDCKHARLLLDFVRPNHPPEVDDDTADDLKRHLDDCAACATLTHDEQRVDDRLGRAMLDVPLPPGLHARVLNRLHAERDAWRRRWLVRAAGVAAALFLVVWAVQAWRSQPAKIDPIPLVGINHHPLENAEDVERAFKEDLGIVMTAPTDLRYAGLLSGYHMAMFQNQQVPYLLLTDRSPHGLQAAVAHIYVLSKNQFDPDDAEHTARNIQSGKFLVSVHKMPDTQFFYIMLYTGAPPDTFVLKPPKVRT